MDIIDYQIMNQACIPGMNPTWSYFRVLLYYLILFVKNFYIYIYEAYLIFVCSFIFFFCTIFLEFWY